MKTQRYGIWHFMYNSSVLHWTRDMDENARKYCDFVSKRLNGDAKIDAPAPDSWVVRSLNSRRGWVDEKSISWIKGKKSPDGKVIYGELESDGYYHFECRYDAHDIDLEFMRETDCNYLKRILKAGQLKALEPDVYCLCKLTAMRCIDVEIAKDFDIGTWWRTYVDTLNIADILKDAQAVCTVYEARQVLEDKCEMLPDLTKIIGEYVTDARWNKEGEDHPKPSCCSMM